MRPHQVRAMERHGRRRKSGNDRQTLVRLRERQRRRPGNDAHSSFCVVCVFHIDDAFSHAAQNYYLELISHSQRGSRSRQIPIVLNLYFP